MDTAGRKGLCFLVPACDVLVFLAPAAQSEVRMREDIQWCSAPPVCRQGIGSSLVSAPAQAW